MLCFTKPNNNDQEQQDIQDVNVNNEDTENIFKVSI